jgi:hypothetical protein
MPTSATIRQQVRLPLSVALGVVLQGIRIRLGRSLVTLTGVVLGIAFLMAILCGQAIRRGVGQETRDRNELRRMTSFLVAETGPLAERELGVLEVGALSPLERRFVTGLARAGVARFRWHQDAAAAGAASAADALPAASLVRVPLAEVGQGVSAVLVLGDGPLPAADWPAILAPARQAVIALGHKEMQLVAPAGAAVVGLERELREEEVEQARLEARRNRFRTGWIILISLTVTVIGISNAMLMSVTERFREIGTMKCLGALSAFIRQIFFIESSLMGLFGSLAGSLFGFAFATLAFVFTYGGELVFSTLNPVNLLAYFGLSLVAGVLLSVVAAIYPASFASRMVPATALRSNI